MENFGERLRRLRGDRSQKEVAQGMGIPQTTLSTLENQQSVPRGEVLARLTEYFKVPITYFYRSHTEPLRSTESAKQFLESIRTEPFSGKPTVATHTESGEDFDEDTKRLIAEKIHQKRAETQRKH
jgi:transcriptional regulator with XRE-family HTH domain